MPAIRSKAAHPPRGPLLTTLLYISLACLWILFSSYLVQLSTEDAALISRIELGKGLVFVLFTGGLFYVLLKSRVPADSEVELSETPDVPPHTSRLLVILASLLLLVLMVGLGIMTYEESRVKEKTLHKLDAISELKAQQLESWLEERRSDVATLANDRGFLEQVVALKSGDPAARQVLMERLGAFRGAYDYASIALLDERNQPLLTEGVPHIAHPGNAHAAVFGPEGRFKVSPLWRDDHDQLHFELSMQLLVPQTGQALGYVHIQIDPAQFLVPYIERWPTASDSAESLLLWGAPETATYLTPPRFADSQALELEHSLSDTDSLAAFALRQSGPGTFEGDDYRRMPVLAAFHPVPNTDWRVIAKLDRDEVIAPVYTLMRWLSVVSLFAVGVICASLLILWRQQQRVYQLSMQAERAKVDRALRHFYELPFIGMAIISPQQRRWLQFNDHLCQILGYSADELAEKGWPELIHPEDLAQDQREFERMQDAEVDCYVRDLRFIRADQKVICASVDVRCVRSPDGSVKYLVATLQDITRRNSTEAALRDSEARLRMVLNTIPDLIWLKDVDGVYLFCNPVFERFFGASEAQIVGNTDYDFVGRELADFFRVHDRRAMEAGGPCVNEERLTFKGDSFQGVFETSKTPVYGTDGRLVGVLGIARDITARKAAEQRLSLVIQGSNDAPWDWDLVQDEMYYSPQWWRMLGYEVNELDSDALLWRRLVHPDDVAAVEAAIDRIVKHDRERDSVECRFQHKQGHYVPTLVRGIATRDESGVPIRLTGTVMDLTERRRMEAEMRESLQRLEKIASRLPGMVYQYQVHPDGRHCMPYVSDAIEGIFELQPEQVREDALKIIDKLLPEEREEVIGWIQSSFEDLSPWQHEFRVRHDDGEVRWVSVNALPQRQDDGSVMWHGFATDITEHKAIEAEVHMAAEVFEQSREGIMITDPDKNIVMVNKAFNDITGYSEAEALGQKPNMLRSQRHGEDFYRQMHEALDNAGFWQGEIWNRRKDGREYPEWLSITRTVDAHGEIGGYIGIFEDITQRKEYEEHIRWLAHYDPLTRLPNRALLTDRANHAISAVQRGNTKTALLFCDLDRFKYVNDTLGHDTGDRLLIEVARRLTAVVREGDTVSRQGGDEFVLLLPDTDAHGAARVAEKVLAKVNQPYLLGEYQLTVSFSIGIAVCPDDGSGFDMLAKHADIAMYHAKHMGRNDYCFFTPELQQMTAHALKLESDLQHAIERDELQLHYQPQVSLGDGRVIGFEALLRWNHPEFGMVAPDEFIPLAERSGQILQLGDWVIRTATRQLKTWIDAGAEPLKVAVNLSVRQLRQPDVVEKLEVVLDETGLDPALLELELTESMLMEDQENVIQTLFKISALGIQIAIDDFGTGYSSLAYLKRLPVDSIKIDRTFVQDMLTKPDDAIIARSIISLGHSLGMSVIAEGVETGDQLDFLRMHNCDQLQGYIFSKPLPVDEVSGLLAEPRRLPLLIHNEGKEGTKILLLVDDEPNILRALGRLLRDDGYRILRAGSGQEALELLALNEVSVIVSDQRMPGMSGVEFLSKAKELYPDTVRIVLSGYADVKFISEAINRGDIYRFLTKPWDNELLRANVSDAFQRYDMLIENRRLGRELKEAHKRLVRFENNHARSA